MAVTSFTGSSVARGGRRHRAPTPGGRPGRRRPGWRCGCGPSRWRPRSPWPATTHAQHDAPVRDLEHVPPVAADVPLRRPVRRTDDHADHHRRRVGDEAALEQRVHAVVGVDPPFLPLVATVDVDGDPDPTEQATAAVVQDLAAPFHPVHRSVGPDAPVIERDAPPRSVARSSTARIRSRSSGCNRPTQAANVPSKSPGWSPNSCSSCSFHTTAPVR